MGIMGVGVGAVMYITTTLYSRIAGLILYEIIQFIRKNYFSKLIIFVLIITSSFGGASMHNTYCSKAKIVKTLPFLNAFQI